MGDLSYPVYLCHILVIDLLADLWGTKLMTQWQMAGAMLASVATAAIILFLIERPSEKYRQSLKINQGKKL